MTLFKKEKNKQGSIATFDLTRDSRNESHGLLQRFPVNQRERLELQPRMERRRYGVPGQNTNIYILLSCILYSINNSIGFSGQRQHKIVEIHFKGKVHIW